MSKLDKHFTATTYIVHANQPITLLHYHRKLRTWLPPGGHLEKMKLHLRPQLEKYMKKQEFNIMNWNFFKWRETKKIR